MKQKNRLKFYLSVVIYILLMTGGAFAPIRALAAVTSITPVTWNIVGLDSNSPLSGPNRFPVGA
ncbi:MAG TPA: hypothetical protein VLA15_09805, partial [Desulfurivibrionaceae bacterium]|nr:hypothetical protein [Desulfurivibrionaceae bacterium]